MDWDKLLAKVSSKGDVATVLIGGAAGFLVDAFSSLHGVISPGYFAGIGASIALGAKSGIDSSIAKSKERNAAQLREKNALQKAKRLHYELKQSSQWKRQAELLAKDIELFKKEILTVDQLEFTTAESLEAYRKLGRLYGEPG